MRSLFKMTLRYGALTLLCVTVLVTFQPILRHAFTSYDDPVYLTNNPMVQAGLTLPGVVWAFTTTTAGMWHPLTLLSLMLDVQLFGMRPEFHHFMSLMYHIVNTVLLCTLLSRMTGSFWPSFLTATLFALHPLHVESVVWCSARKDLVSALFWLLAISSYHAYTRTGTLKNYLIALFLFVAGLLAKPMVVTLPFVLLLLDYWPLGRLVMPKDGSLTSIAGSIKPLFVEKLPFIILSLAASVVTYDAQDTARQFASWLGLSPLDNLANVLISYIVYLRKTLAPIDLAVVYSLNPSNISYSLAAGAFVALLIISCGVLRLSRRQPAVTVGWFWYLGTLVPVIGIVRVGIQSMADRYTYLPLVGIFVAFSWGVAALISRFNFLRRLAVAVCATIILACIFTSRRQISFWSDDLTLYSHAAEVVPDNWFAYNEISGLMLEQGRNADAVSYADKVLALRPDYYFALIYRGTAFLNMGDLDRAYVSLMDSLRLAPNSPETYYNLGLVYVQRKDEAGARWAYGQLSSKSTQLAQRLLDEINSSSSRGVDVNHAK